MNNDTKAATWLATSLLIAAIVVVLFAGVWLGVAASP